MKFNLASTKKLVLPLLFFAVVCAGFAQDKKDDGKKIQYVESDTLTIDMENQVIIMNGNVIIKQFNNPPGGIKWHELSNDQMELKLMCDSMKIYFEDKADAAKSSGKSESADLSGKQIHKVECFRDVNLKRFAPTEQVRNGKQVVEVTDATSDYAVYDLKKGTLTLTGRPILRNYKGIDKEKEWIDGDNDESSRMDCDKIIAYIEQNQDGGKDKNNKDMPSFKVRKIDAIMAKTHFYGDIAAPGKDKK